MQRSLACLLLVLNAFDVALAEATIREEQVAARAAGIQLPDSRSEVEAKYDRFPNGGPTVAGVFKWDQEDWSGVGHRAGGYEWATLIAGKFFVTAQHTRVQNDMIFYFFRGYDRTAFSRQLVDAHHRNSLGELVAIQIADSDLALGRFQQSVPNSYATYPVFLRQELATPRTAAVNPYSAFRDRLVQFGQSAAPPDSKYDDGMDITHLDPVSQKLGTNTAYETPHQSDGRIIPYMFEEVNNPAEFMPRNFSSGAPSFKLIGQHPVVAGVHSSVSGYEATDLSIPIPDTIVGGDGLLLLKDHQATFRDVAIGFYRNELNAAISAEQPGVPTHEQQFIVYYTMDKEGNHLSGDYDGDFVLDGDDIDLMLREVRMRQRENRGYNWYLDWNSDNKIDDADATFLIRNVFGTRRGDLDLDGDVDRTDDQRLIASMGKSRTQWVTGDLNGDGKTDQQDHRILRRNLRR